METDARRAKRDALRDEALALDGAAREAFLDRECDSPSMRREIEALLRSEGDDLGHPLDHGAAARVDRRLSPGDRVGRYVIEAQVGSGGMSDVLRAHDPVIGRQVALKVLTWSGSDEQRRRRFFAELRLMGRIVHDNVVRVYDFGEHDGMAYLVTELLDGEDLAHAIAGGRCGDIRNRLTIARQVASAVRHVHAAGILHRDIKPANVFLEKSGRAKLLDFGIARDDHAGVTSSALVGTPGYLAPEQLQGAAASVRSDVYAFGVLLFEMFSGERLYRGSVAEVLYAVAHQPVPLELLRGYPSSLIDVVRKCTLKDPAQRVEDFDALLRLLNSSDVSPGASTTGRESVRHHDPGDRLADPDETGHRIVRAGSSLDPNSDATTVLIRSGNSSTPSTRRRGIASRRVALVAAAAVVVSIGGVVVWMDLPDAGTSPTANSPASTPASDAAPALSNPAVTSARQDRPPSVGDSLPTQLTRIAQLNQAGRVAAALAELDRISASDDPRVSALARSVAQVAARSMDAALLAATSQRAAELAPVPFAAGEAARQNAVAASARQDYVHSGRQALVAADAYRRAESQAQDVAVAAAKTTGSGTHQAGAASSAVASPTTIPEGSTFPRADTPTATAANPAGTPGAGAPAVEQAAIMDVLERYKQAYSARSMRALQAVYPNLPQEISQRVERQFRGCLAYDVHFDNAIIESHSTVATVTTRTTYLCQATGSNREPDQRSVQQVFSLRKRNGEWVIERLEDGAR